MICEIDRQPGRRRRAPYPYDNAAGAEQRIHADPQEHGAGKGKRASHPLGQHPGGVDIADRLVDERPRRHRSTDLEHVDPVIETAGRIELVLEPPVEQDDRRVDVRAWGRRLVVRDADADLGDESATAAQVAQASWWQRPTAAG